MLRLRTFGGLTLARGGEDLTGAITQRRRLALLALLAVAGAPGLSRDKLLACLWPESDAERARHVLNQLLYAQRRQVGGGDLFLGRKTLRLNPAVITTDVGGFEEAVATGRLAVAADLYAGPFLDGFFMKDSPEFERWAEEQRARWAQRALEVLVELARNTQDPGQAVHWWRRAATTDQFDSRVALRLVEALASAGDRPGALREAARYVDRLGRDLGVAPDPEFQRAVARIRDLHTFT